MYIAACVLQRVCCSVCIELLVAVGVAGVREHRVESSDGAGSNSHKY